MAPRSITVLGAGSSGLCVGYFARKAGVPFRILEAGGEIGGNAITYRHGEFLYDSGAHRWHDKDPEMTAEVQTLLGERLKKIFVPSRIFHHGRFVDFPLSPLNLFFALGPFKFSQAACEVLAARLGNGRTNDESFESFALRTYGQTIAERFLLNYSEKLWGAPCRELSPNIAGKRMKGLNLKTFLKEAFVGSKAKTEHLDGSFYYPDNGIGVIADAIAEACGRSSIRTQTKVTRVFHDGGRITAIEVNGNERIETDHVVNTLPLNRLLQMMEPAPPAHILELANTLRFRHIVLIALFIDHEPVTRAATVYFPDPDFMFTRLYEPVNRSPRMAPAGKTSLVVELPCQTGDEAWKMDDERLISLVRDGLMRTGWVGPETVLGGEVRRMPDAYPILQLGFEEKVETIFGYINGFRNLSSSGRGGTFRYIHLHDMMRLGKQIVEDISAGAAN